MLEKLPRAKEFPLIYKALPILLRRYSLISETSLTFVSGRFHNQQAQLAWLLHHSNSPAHTSLLVRNFLANNNTVIMPQPPYSPDLAPCDFLLFPKLKRPMKGRSFVQLRILISIMISNEVVNQNKMLQFTLLGYCLRRSSF